MSMMTREPQSGRQSIPGFDPEFDPEDGFLVRNRNGIIAGCVLVIILAVAAVFILRTAEAPPAQIVQKITIIAVQPPKPPPPPPPPVQQQMIQQPKITTPIEKPIEPAPPTKVAPPKAAAPSTQMSTSIKGNTANNFDLSGSGSGDGLLDGGGGGGSGAWSYYASLLQTQINSALQKNPKTSHASFQVTARIWLDASGRVTRALVAPSGNNLIDDAIQNEVFAGTKFGQPPPAGMPMPIVISLTGEQPL